MEKTSNAYNTSKMPSRGEYSGQDWNTVSFGSKGGGGGGGGGAKQTQAVKRPGGPGTSSGISAAALENETEELKHATVSKELKLAISQARTAKGLTQKQLATQLNMQPQVINEYESGKAIPNNQVIAKIERALGAKLPRAPKK